MRLAISGIVEHANEGRVLTCLWAVPNGTVAWAIEHGGACWELRVVRRGRLIAQHRCSSFSDLITAAIAAHRLVDD
jgi:hypothetical protein